MKHSNIIVGGVIFFAAFNSIPYAGAVAHDVGEMPHTHAESKPLQTTGWTAASYGTSGSTLALSSVDKVLGIPY